MKELVKFLVCCIVALFLLPFIFKVVIGILMLVLAVGVGLLLYAAIKIGEFAYKLSKKEKSNQ